MAGGWLVSLWLAGCGPATIPPTAITSPLAATPTAVAVPSVIAPGASVEVPYPGPATLAPPTTVIAVEPYPGAAPTDIPIPVSIDPKWLTPQPGKGAVVGRLVSQSPNGSPVLGDLYLSGLLKADRANAPPIVRLATDSDPKAVVRTQDGGFAFSNVPPGDYILVAWTPGNAFIVEPAGEGPKHVVVKAGELTDLKTIVLP